MAQMDPWESGSRTRLREDFVDGLRHFRSDDWEGALPLFRKADENADMDDVYQNRYTSFHGLARVLMGDKNGVKLCRKAAVGEQNDVEVYYNLAMAEHRLDYRESAYTALRRGLRIDKGHPGLIRLEQEFTLREKCKLVPGVRRDGFINRTLGKMFRGSRKPWNSR
ncbi:MAG: hypothetical protein ABFS22_02205 [Pseudomonadota bacterium]